MSSNVSFTNVTSEDIKDWNKMFEFLNETTIEETSYSIYLPFNKETSCFEKPAKKQKR